MEVVTTMEVVPIYNGGGGGGGAYNGGDCKESLADIYEPQVMPNEQKGQ